MSENIQKREKRRELLITVSFSIFSVLMIIVTNVENWPIWYIPIITVNMGVVWWSYATRFRTYYYRAVVVTLLMCEQVFMYGIWGEHFNYLIPTLCVQFTLISLYEVTRIMTIPIVETIILFLYLALVKGNFIIPEDHLGRNRMMLQLVSFLVLIVLCVYRIHHHVQEEEDLDNMEKQVREEQRIKEDFVSNTSHELRTPINTISGNSEILLQKALPDDIHSGILDIQMTSVELQNIVTDILDYASLESGTLELKPRAYSITSTLNDVMNMTTFENREKQLEIIFDCDPNIPRLTEGDEHQLRRVLNNLIGNAIKFTTEGGVLVKVGYRPERYGINLIISVKDSGVGISLEDQENIMRGFYQADSDRNRKAGGMGLGLPISAALIRKMGGFLTIKSAQGKGSEFTFAIPQKVLDEKPCITLEHPGTVNLIWYYRTKSNVDLVKNAFAAHINNLSDYFGILSYQTASLDECKRRLSRTSNAQLVLGSDEYMEDKAFFDRLAKKETVILIAGRDDDVEPSSDIHMLYKPYNAMMFAEIINGGETAVAVQKRERKAFVAPEAKILVVDDNLMNLKVVEGLLRKYKIKIVGATSGEEALTLIESRDFDFVFMDHMMPGMDGVECFHHIRDKADPYFKRVPIVALTANAIAGSREMFLSEGFNDFVAKPIDSALMNDVLQSYIPLEKQIYEDDERYAELVEKPKASKKAKDKKAEGSKAAAKAAPSAPVKKEAQAPKPKKEEKKKEEPGRDIFASLEGIDKETAIMYCGSEEDFVELADMYCQSAVKYRADLEKAFEEMDMGSYALISHTIKSTSRTLGATELSELALVQELAAKDDKRDTIRDNHENFLEMYKKTTDMFAGVTGEEAAGDDSYEEEAKEAAVTPAKPEKAKGSEIDAAEWKELKAKIEDALNSFETDTIEESLASIEGRMLNGRAAGEVLSKVIEKANNFEFDEAIAELKKIGGKA